MELIIKIEHPALDLQSLHLIDQLFLLRICLSCRLLSPHLRAQPDHTHSDRPNASPPLTPLAHTKLLFYTGSVKIIGCLVKDTDCRLLTRCNNRSTFNLRANLIDNLIARRNQVFTLHHI